MIDHITARAIAVRGSHPSCSCQLCVLARAYLDAVDTLKRCADAIEEDGHILSTNPGAHEVQQAAAKARAIAGGNP